MPSIWYQTTGETGFHGEVGQAGEFSKGVPLDEILARLGMQSERL